MTLDEIIEWNQDKLDMDFELGCDQDVSEAYRQILISGTPFQECRVFILNSSDAIEFHMIFPESKASSESIDFAQRISESVWNLMQPILIQTTDELDDSTSILEYKNGAPASCRYFCFVEENSHAISTQNIRYVRLKRGYLGTPYS